MSSMMDWPSVGSESSVMFRAGSGAAEEGKGAAWLWLWGGAGVELTKLTDLCLEGEGRTASLTRSCMRELSLQKEASLAAVSSCLNT